MSLNLPVGEPTVCWTFTFTCWQCFSTVQVIDGQQQPHDCWPKHCDVPDCEQTAVGMITVTAREPDTHVREATPGVVLLCDRHHSTPPAHWNDETAEVSHDPRPQP